MSPMDNIRRRFEESGKTLDELGQAMGYAPEMARKSAWQFLKKTDDPRLSMVEKFCAAMGITLQELLADDQPKKKKTNPK